MCDCFVVCKWGERDREIFAIFAGFEHVLFDAGQKIFVLALLVLFVENAEFFVFHADTTENVLAVFCEERIFGVS